MTTAMTCQNTSPLSDLVFVPMKEGGIPAGWHSCLRLCQELSNIAPESSSGEEYKVCDNVFVCTRTISNQCEIVGSHFSARTISGWEGIPTIIQLLHWPSKLMMLIRIISTSDGIQKFNLYF